MFDYSTFSYIPALRTRASEMAGYKNLSSHDKSLILPMFTLGKWPRSEEIITSYEKINAATEDNSYILDVTKETQHHTTSSKSLLDPADNYKAWIDFLRTNCNSSAIPIVQMSAGDPIRNIVKQAQKIEFEYERLAFRLTNQDRDITKVISALAAIDDNTNALVIIDSGYVRGNLSLATSQAITSINTIRNEFPNADISVISSSFPSSVTPFCSSSDQDGNIEILERDYYFTLGGKDVCIYGDYASIHPVVYDDAGGRYVPRIDVPYDSLWHFERRPGQDSRGYVDAAIKILKKHPHLLSDKTWGAQMICDAAKGKIEGMGSPAKWIAVRVNLHLSMQIREMAKINLADPDEEDFFF